MVIIEVKEENIMRFRKVLKFGPLKLNFSMSGVGASIGAKHARVGLSSKGKKYCSYSIPNTGLYDMKYEDKDGNINL